MELPSEFLAQTSPICGGVFNEAVASRNEFAVDLNPGFIDLASINLDFCDLVASNNNNNTTFNHLENQSANLESSSAAALTANQYIEDRRAVDIDEIRCFEGLELLDFDLNEEVLMALSDLGNLHHTHLAMSPEIVGEVNSPGQIQTTEASYFMDNTNMNSQINSPSAERTCSILDSSSLATTMNNTTIGSPDDSVGGDESVINYNYYSSSAEESPAAPTSTSSKLRRTRVRTIGKKESNKAAAIKYRTKKMKERESLFAECEEYVKRNAELKKKIDETQSEISFIKSLLVEALIAKSVPK